MTHSKSLADIAANLQGYDPQALPAHEVLNFFKSTGDAHLRGGRRSYF